MNKYQKVISQIAKDDCNKFINIKNQITFGISKIVWRNVFKNHKSSFENMIEFKNYNKKINF